MAGVGVGSVIAMAEGRACGLDFSSSAICRFSSSVFLLVLRAQRFDQHRFGDADRRNDLGRLAPLGFGPFGGLGFDGQLKRFRKFLVLGFDQTVAHRLVKLSDLLREGVDLAVDSRTCFSYFSTRGAGARGMLVRTLGANTETIR